MTKIIIATHGPLAEALKESIKMFFDEKSNSIYSIGLYPADSPTDLLDKFKNIIKNNESEDFLFLVDIFGGTPFNMVALLIEEHPEINIQCLTGVNLPLLMEVMATHETLELDDMMISLKETAEESIINLRESLDL